MVSGRFVSGPRLLVALGTLAVLGVALAIVIGVGGGPDRPHVVIIVMDTARADRCSVGGYGRSTTPALEALAREGVTFRRAWSPCSWTAPSHASLFTGLVPRRHGLSMGNSWLLSDESVTLAEILRGEGYRTGCWSDNPVVSPKQGLIQGFDTFVEVYRRGPRSVSRAHESHREALAWALDAHREGERFFLFVNAIEPHLPYTPPLAFQDRFVPRVNTLLLEAARTFESPRQLQYCLGRLELDGAVLRTLSHLYDAEIAAVDDAVGELVEGLREAGILDETLFIVTSDHGEALGEDHMIGHNLSMRRRLLHVPLVVRYPGGRDAGRVVDDLVRLEDVMPTCLEVCGVEIPEGLDARSLTGDLAGRMARGYLGPPDSRSMYAALEEAGATGFDVSIRSASDGRYHYLRYSDGRHELFDLAEDPEETTNVAERLPAAVERMAKILAGE